MQTQEQASTIHASANLMMTDTCIAHNKPTCELLALDYNVHESYVEAFVEYAMTEHKRRFTFHADLSASTPFMGSTVGEWDESLTGHGQFQKQLDVIKARVRNKDVKAKLDVSSAPLDLASSYRKLKVGR